jgi:3-deoxy-D-manno-octulosonate 8-phosphate phosphatase (KDO 8-P phosphatase)
MDGVVNEFGADRLGADEAQRRARSLALVLTDIDGVFTDGGIYYSDSGEALRRFSVRDGMGVERLRRAGIMTGVVSGERSGTIERRAEKLGLELLYLGVKDKAALLPDILRRTGLELSQLAFIGDDYNDLALLGAVGDRGLTAAPADALPAVRAAVHFRTLRPGGHGAFRDFVEWLLSLRE